MRVVRLATAAGAVVALSIALLAPASPGGLSTPPPSGEFGCTGAAQTYTVPAGVTKVNVELFGAQGGSGISVDPIDAAAGTGGQGGHTTATIDVTPGETLQVNVGCAGSDAVDVNGGAGGFNGGADGGTGGHFGFQAGGGGGGGASDVRQGGTGLADRVLVAGGGGCRGCRRRCRARRSRARRWRRRRRRRHRGHVGRPRTVGSQPRGRGWLRRYAVGRRRGRRRECHRHRRGGGRAGRRWPGRDRWRDPRGHWRWWRRWRTVRRRRWRCPRQRLRRWRWRRRRLRPRADARDRCAGW